MDQITNISISSNKSLIHPMQNSISLRQKTKICNECNQKRKIYNEIDQTCHQCHRVKTIPLSGNKIIDDFVRYTLTNDIRMPGRMEFIPYNRFKDVKFIAEGGFSKIYKATWIDGPISKWNNKKQKY